jgi:F0F1-type ATP synthase membrane subunit b/b'
LSRRFRQALVALALGACLGAPVFAWSRQPRAASAALAFPEESSEEKTASREIIYKIVNFVILVGALVYFLRKPAAAYFAARSASIRKGIEEGRKALEASEAELRLVEEKLARLEQEIRAFEEAARLEIAAEEGRFRQETEAEGKKMLEFARARLSAAARAARQEVQAFAAAEALRLAEQSVRERLDAPRRDRLFAWYLAGLGSTELASRK